MVHPLVEEYIKAGKDIKHFESAHELSPEDHLEIQEICQRHIDNSISKTINLPSDFSVEKLSKAMRKSIDHLKGITIYRDGSKGNSPLVPATGEETRENLQNIIVEVLPEDCPSGACEVK